MTSQRMTAAMDTTPIPPYAVTMWSDEINIYVAIPVTKGQIPYIMRFRLDEGGLSSALRVLRKPPPEAPIPTIDRPANYTIPPQPMVHRTKAQQRLYAETTESQRAMALKVLAKMGIK
jgi:hypothetical protein